MEHASLRSVSSSSHQGPGLLAVTGLPYPCYFVYRLYTPVPPGSTLPGPGLFCRTCLLHTLQSLPLQVWNAWCLVTCAWSSQFHLTSVVWKCTEAHVLSRHSHSAGRRAPCTVLEHGPSAAPLSPSLLQPLFIALVAAQALLAGPTWGWSPVLGYFNLFVWHW